MSQVNKTKKLPVPRKRKNKTYSTKKFYCQICGKYFTTKSSHGQHMSSFHNDDTLFKVSSSNVIFKKTLMYRTTNEKFWFNPTDIFTEFFENEMPSDFKNDNEKLRCLSCHIHFENETEYKKHEIIHYRPSSVNNNVDVNHETSSDKNVGVSLKVDEFSETKCDVCKKMFTTMSDFDEHKNKNCKFDKPINHVNSIKSKENDEHENMKKSLKSKPGPLKFDCCVCKQMCEHPEHLKLNEWWSGSEIISEFKCYECYVCNEQFFDEEKFIKHQVEHVQTNMC